MANPKPLFNPAPAGCVVLVRDAVAVRWVDVAFPMAVHAIKGCKACRWRADIILEANPHADRTADSAREVHRVKVAQRL